MEREGEDVIRFDVGRPSFDTPKPIKEATKKALDEGYVHYDDYRGFLELRRAIAKKLRIDNGIDADPDKEIITTTGSTHASFAAIMANIDEGEEVICFEPGYFPHINKVKFAGGRVRLVTLKESNSYQLEGRDLEEAVTPRTKMIILVNPHNPTGRVYSKQELSTLAEVAIRHDLLVLSDEAYEYIVYDGRRQISIASLQGMKDRTISVFAFTKTFAMDGWRMGYATANQEIIERMLQVTKVSTSHATVFTQKGAVIALEEGRKWIDDMLKEDLRRRDLTVRRLREIEGISCPVPEGAIYAFPNVKAYDHSSARLSEYLLDKVKVATGPGVEFGHSGEGHLRICYGAANYEQCVEGFDRLADALRTRRG